MNRQKRFRDFFRFRKDIRIFSTTNLPPPSVSLRGDEIFKKLKNVGLYLNSSYIFLKINFHHQDNDRLAKTKLMPAKLRAVLACAISDPAQC